MQQHSKLLVLASALVFAFVAWPCAATTVTPIVVDGNPTCADLGLGQFSFKIDPPTSGTFSLDGINSVTVAIGAGPLIDWSATIGIDAVIVKGGPVANVYEYDPEATSDTGLTTPTNPNNHQPYGLSHVDFCFDYEVAVTKTAATTFTRSYSWSINKSVSPALWSLFAGDSGTSLYTVGVTRTGYVDSDWAVSGTITIHNPATFAATLTAVTDAMSSAVSPAPTAAVDCGVTFPYTLASNTDLQCTYSGALPDGSARVNTATATTTGAVGPGSGTANVTFGDPTTVVNGTINVTDSNGGSWAFSDTGSVQYGRTFSCNADQGTHGNTATITQTGQSASASVSVACYGLQVTKSASTSLDRTWNWTIDKVADQTELTLAPGESFPVNYQVRLNATTTDSNWAAQGTITVVNSNPALGAVLNGLADSVDGVTAVVDCGAAFPRALAAGGTMTCTYVANLPSGADRTNTATATLQNYSYAADGTPTTGGTTAYSGQAQVLFSGAAIARIDSCVAVTDTVFGALGNVCWDETLPKTFSYSRYVGPYSSPDGCGDHNVVNTASFVTNNNGHTGEDSWTVVAHVPCARGCTLTQGYWKTHSQRGPAPYDKTWALLPGGLQQDTPFFLSGKTYYQVMWTPPAGNAYYILADQYIAAVLNALKGTSAPSEVISALNEATGDFQSYTPTYIGSLKAGSPLRKRMLELAGLLDMYNNGLIGPGHCSE